MTDGHWTLLPGTSRGRFLPRPISVNVEDGLIRRGREVHPFVDLSTAALERPDSGGLVLILAGASGFTASIPIHDGRRPVLHEVTRRLIATILPLTSIPAATAPPGLSRNEVATLMAEPPTSVGSKAFPL